MSQNDQTQGATLSSEQEKPGTVPVHYEYTGNLPYLLMQLRISLIVSTYQAGKVLAIGTHEGKLEFAVSNFEQAMGVAVDPGRLAVGTRRQIWFLRNAPELARQLQPMGKYDACYLTRSCHYTGPIHVHEMAWSRNELWLVNTLFSCLCTLSEDYSFVPRWQPPFISRLAAEDRCHLNGLCLEEGKPRYVTALAEVDTPAGWRPTKATSGCVIDVPSGETLARGFAMAHSPRLHQGQLYVLDSGYGRISWVDRKTGHVEPVAHVEGYTRGLSFYGPYAFVGLSRIRETSVFGGIPIAERREQLKCGVEVIELGSGRSVASLQFHSGVTEIFDVYVLPGITCPTISGPLPDVDGGSPIWLVPSPPPSGRFNDIPR
ncbi:MAG: TIGR03032 family protein [Gemmatales bacterium]|nr:TIGR03032 family protein [Gemmatales bacterium]MDW7995180.1 TIGR03032 family protein [Gemmatales bacterium]